MIRLVAVTVCGVFLVAEQVWAEEVSDPANSGALDVRLFRAAVDSKGLFTINASEVMPHLGISFGLVLDYGHNVFGVTGLEWSDVDGDTVADEGEARKIDAHLVRHLVDANLAFNLGLFNFMVVGLSVPVLLLTGEPTMGVAGWNRWTGGVGSNAPNPTPSFSTQHIGDLEVHTKFRFLRIERNPVGLGAILQVFTPTGQADRALGSEPGLGLGGTVIVDTAPVDWFFASLNVGARFFVANERGYAPVRLVDAAGQVFEYGHLLTFGLGMSFTLVRDRLEAVVEYYGNTTFGDFFDPLHTPMEVVTGLKIFLERNSYLYLGGGTGIFSPGFSGAEARVFGACIFEPSIGDRDRDGIKDDADQCPDDPEDLDDFEDSEGCPDPDNDRDGILDVEDDCPMIPEDRDGDKDDDGCPEGALGDRDGDLILDVNDRCPDDPEDRDGFEDIEGCPDPDNDRDTIRDDDDLCPNDPEDRDGFNDADGCPDLDNDMDRILDVDDDCPNDPEVYNGTEDEDGCPDEGRVVVTGTEVVIMEKIYFQTDSAVILPVSYDILNQVAATLNGNPHITLVEVQGHADERNTDEYNIRLTRDRANAVVEYLVRQGVSPDRLLATGYGERCPVDPGRNERAWERNRRVEFKILATEAGLTRVERSCPAGVELQTPIPQRFRR